MVRRKKRVQPPWGETKVRRTTPTYPFKPRPKGLPVVHATATLSVSEDTYAMVRHIAETLDIPMVYATALIVKRYSIPSIIAHLAQ